MTIYIIGIGLNDEKDITLKGLDAVKKSKKIYLEYYTSKLNCGIKNLEKLYGKKIILADRNLIESNFKKILKEAKKEDVALLVIGDIFSATTHASLFLNAKKEKVEVKIIHNASILTAIGIVGLELYKYGKITSIPFDNENIKSPLEVLKKNSANDLHTLFLLDLDPDGNKFMTVNLALEYLLKNKIGNRLCVGCGAIGSENPEIKVEKAEDLVKEKFTKFPQCLIVPSKKLHFVEKEMLNLYK